MYAAANNFDFSVDFGMSGWYKQPVQYRRESAHKGRAAWAVFSLGVCMRERQHIYEDLNESSSASPRGSQQLEIPPSPNSKSGPPTFPRSAGFSPVAGISTPAKILSFSYISARRQHFENSPIFLESANIFEIRQYFGDPPIFWKSANILGIR